MILAAQLLLSLSILIILHEFGHFLPAKLFKIRVEKFYLFFDPYFSPLNASLMHAVVWVSVLYVVVWVMYKKKWFVKV